MLVRIARLIVCDGCGLHATIVFSDGSESEELFSEADAFACIAKGVMEQRLHPVEADHLREGVRKSQLPLETPEGARQILDQYKRQSAVGDQGPSKRLH